MGRAHPTARLRCATARVSEGVRRHLAVTIGRVPVATRHGHIVDVGRVERVEGESCTDRRGALPVVVTSLAQSKLHEETEVYL